MRWLRRLFRPAPEAVEPEVEMVEDKVPCGFGSHWHTADEVRQEHAANDGGHWSTEATAAFPVNRDRMTPGQEYRGHGGRAGWWLT